MVENPSKTNWRKIMKMFGTGTKIQKKYDQSPEADKQKVKMSNSCQFFWFYDSCSSEAIQEENVWIYVCSEF